MMMQTIMLHVQTW